MTITLNSYDRQRRAGTYQYVKVATQSTATVLREIDITADVYVFGQGTATFGGGPDGGIVNGYYLGSGVEGQEMLLYCLATGVAQVRLNTQVSGRQPYNVAAVLAPTATAVDLSQTSATGFYVLGVANSYIKCIWRNAAWHVTEARLATLSTGT